MSPALPLFELGFRPFFLAAGLFAALTMALWAGILHGLLPPPAGQVPAPYWHAHEMIYGYALAVVAGFLLTAVRNWTGITTWHGGRLAALCGCWLLARAAVIAGAPATVFAAVCDGLFWCALTIAVAGPVLRARQWRQSGILAKLVLFGVGQALFYSAAFGLYADGARIGVVGGLYLLVGLVMTIGARVLPGFIERGVGVPVKLLNPSWVTPASLSLFLPYFILELGARASRLAGVLAAGLFLLNAYRLWAWHSPALWRKPLLWGLYLAFASITAGFLLRASAELLALPRTLVLHLFAVGGIGLATLAMMARVALGHSGRDIHRPPRAVGLALGLLLAGTLARVAVPLAWPSAYTLALGLSQLLWIAAFALFVVTYLPILSGPRRDAAPG